MRKPPSSTGHAPGASMGWPHAANAARHKDANDANTSAVREPVSDERKGSVSKL